MKDREKRWKQEWVFSHAIDGIREEYVKIRKMSNKDSFIRFLRTKKQRKSRKMLSFNIRLVYVVLHTIYNQKPKHCIPGGERMGKKLNQF